MAESIVKRIHYAKVYFEFSLAGNNDKFITPAEIASKFGESHSGNIVEHWAEGGPQPLSNWSTYAVIMWQPNNQRYAIRSIGTGTQSYRQTFIVAY